MNIRDVWLAPVAELSGWALSPPCAAVSVLLQNRCHDDRSRHPSPPPSQINIVLSTSSRRRADGRGLASPGGPGHARGPTPSVPVPVGGHDNNKHSIIHHPTEVCISF